MKIKLSTFALVLTLSFGAFHARAGTIVGPIINPANGHTYFLLSQNTWTASESEALTLGGHLATVNDATENDWIYDTFGGATRNLWIGYNDIALEGTFVWADGSTSNFTNWNLGQPDNAGGTQDAAYIFSAAASYPNFVGRKWDDVVPTDTAAGLGTPVPLHGVVEVVPEPSAYLMIVASSFAFCGFRFRSRAAQ